MSVIGYAQKSACYQNARETPVYGKRRKSSATFNPLSSFLPRTCVAERIELQDVGYKFVEL
jgi:hypothetical protein